MEEGLARALPMQQTKRYVVKQNFAVCSALPRWQSACSRPPAWRRQGRFSANTTESKDSSDADAKSEPDSDAFGRIAVDACVESAADSGVSEDMAQEYCDCAIDKMLENMSSEQIADIALSGDSELPSDVEEELMNAVLDCIDKLME
jgi:hypothetical protein